MQEAGPTKFLVGSEHGIILSCTKRPKKQAHGHVKLQQSWDLWRLSDVQTMLCLGLGSAARRSRPGHCCLCTWIVRLFTRILFFVISRSVRGLKSEGAAIFLLANKGGNWHLVWFGRSWRLRQALWSGVFREAQSLPCEVLPVRRGLVRKDVDGRAERRAVKRCGGMEGPFRNDPNFFDWPIVKAVERSMQSWEHGDPGGGVCVYGIFSFSITKSQTHSQTHPETDPSNTPRNRHLKHTPQAHPETDT